MGWTEPKLKLRTAHESVGWLNSVGPVSVSSTSECDNPECGCHAAIKEYRERLAGHKLEFNPD